MLLRLAESGINTTKTEAKEQLKAALTLDSSISEADYQLGSLELEQGQWTEALKHLEAAEKLHPDESKTHFALARTYRRLERKQDAAKEMALYQKLKDREEQHTYSPSPAGMVHD